MRDIEEDLIERTIERVCKKFSGGSELSLARLILDLHTLPANAPAVAYLFEAATACLERLENRGNSEAGAFRTLERVVMGVLASVDCGYKVVDLVDFIDGKYAVATQRKQLPRAKRKRRARAKLLRPSKSERHAVNGRDNAAVQPAAPAVAT